MFQDTTSTLNFSSHTDESFKDETRVYGYNFLITEIIWQTFDLIIDNPKLTL